MPNRRGCDRAEPCRRLRPPDRQPLPAAPGPGGVHQLESGGHQAGAHHATSEECPEPHRDERRLSAIDADGCALHMQAAGRVFGSTVDVPLRSAWRVRARQVGGNRVCTASQRSRETRFPECLTWPRSTRRHARHALGPRRAGRLPACEAAPEPECLTCPRSVSWGNLWHLPGTGHTSAKGSER